MKLITKFNRFIDDWRAVKNHCRTTDNKDFTDKDFETKMEEYKNLKIGD